MTGQSQCQNNPGVQVRRENSKLLRKGREREGEGVGGRTDRCRNGLLHHSLERTGGETYQRIDIHFDSKGHEKNRV